MTYQQEIEYAAYRAAKKARKEGKLDAIKLLLTSFSPEEIIKLGFTKEDVEAAQNSEMM